MRKLLVLLALLLWPVCAHAQVDGDGPAHHGNVNLTVGHACGHATQSGGHENFSVTCEPIPVNENANNDISTLEDRYSSVLIGNRAGASLNNEPDSVYLGNDAGQFMLSQGYYEKGNFATTGNGMHNVAIGPFAMGNASNSACTADTGAGSYTVAIGAYAGYNQTCTHSGFDNDFLGDHAGANNTTGSGNTFVGGDVGGFSTGNLNTVLGYNASGFQASSGSNNTIIGAQVASTTLQTGSNNILIGVDNTTDTASSSTSNYLEIKGISGGTAVMSATGLNGTPTVGIATATPNANTLSINGAANSKSVTLSISTATFTPTINTGNDFILTLVHASCPCTLANPSGTLIPGQKGVIYVIQSSTGSDTIGTWGSQYQISGGTSAITLSTAANAVDMFGYEVRDSSHITLVGPATNVTH